MFRKTTYGLENCSFVSPENSSAPDDDYYVRKYGIKPFSIKVKKMSDKEIEEQKQKYVSSKYNAQIPSRSLKKEESPKQCRTAQCNCGCGSIDEDYYKNLFSIQECQICVPKLTDVGKLANKGKKFSYGFVMKICLVFITVILFLFMYFI